MSGSRNSKRFFRRRYAEIFEKVYSYLEFLGALIWVGVGLYSIWLGFSKLFKDNSFSIGGVEVVSLLDTTPVAIMFIFAG